MKVFLVLFFALLTTVFSQDNRVKLKYDSSKAPADNPLKGFVPYSGDGLNGQFPFSMEWFYLGLKDIMNGPESFTFETSLEKKLKEAASRGKQSIFRIYLDYPSEGHAVPQFLIDNGHKLISYKNDDTDNKGGLSPDYKDENLIKAMEASIKAMGKKYDGDPRIGFITVGYLGHWGEWHTYPNEHLMAKRDVQLRIIKAFYTSFKETKFLLRYPDYWDKSMPCGFHDDSFCAETLFSKKKDWYFQSKATKAGTLDIWKSQPIGGELYPPFQKKIWTSKPPKKAENYEKCVQESHCSWLINNAVFNGKWDKGVKAQAIQGAKLLGYEFFVESFLINDSELKVKISNKGVAPFYYQWPIKLVNLDTQESIITDWDIRRILPGTPTEFKIKVTGKNFGLQVNNPMKGGKEIMFANETQNENLLILK
ncbi:MAG: DUF4832 domain-containing protein [Lentisphaeraceae bacterium]|nr:DUF4832 domain-containing protein [Lentisphaeraceae bacterium]